MPFPIILKNNSIIIIIKIGLVILLVNLKNLIKFENIYYSSIFKNNNLLLIA